MRRQAFPSTQSARLIGFELVTADADLETIEISEIGTVEAGVILRS